MKVFSALLLSLLPLTGFAQRNVSIRPQRPATEAVVTPLFRLDPRAANHSLSTYLPGDALLIIESRGLSYWPERTELQRLARLAAGAMVGVLDSFHSATSEKCVSVAVPMDESSHTVQYTENLSTANLVLRSGGVQAALKAGFDTVRILKTYGIKRTRKDTSQPQQIQYTFVLKSLPDLQAIAASDTLLGDVARTMDSVVAARRKRWGSDDAWYHSLETVYRPETAVGERGRLVVQRGPDEKGDRGIWKGVEFSGSFGLTLLRNTVTPTVDLGIGYRWPARNPDESRFVRLSQSSLFQFRGEVYAPEYTRSVVSFLNLEYGKIFNRPRTLLPLYRSSFGIGYGYLATNLGGALSSTLAPPLQTSSFRFFLSYSATKLVNVIPELYAGPGIAGYIPAITIKFNL